VPTQLGTYFSSWQSICSSLLSQTNQPSTQITECGHAWGHTSPLPNHGLLRTSGYPANEAANRGQVTIALLALLVGLRAESTGVLKVSTDAPKTHSHYLGNFKLQQSD